MQKRRISVVMSKKEWILGLCWLPFYVLPVSYTHLTPGGVKLRAAEGADRYYLGVASPTLADGAILGCVMILMDEQGQGFDDADQKIAQTAAGFLGKQMES